MPGLLSAALLAAALLLTTSTLITPTQLREQLAQPAAGRYQQQLVQLRTRSAVNGEPDLNEFNQLATDPQLTPAAREWLLHEFAISLREQAATPSARQLLLSLRDYPSQVFLEQDFEGRTRPIMLAPVAAAARATLAWWQQQERASVIQKNLSSDSLSAIAGQWSSLETNEQSAWLLAVQRTPKALPVRLVDMDSTTLAQQAPALAAALASQLANFDLAAAVLHHDHSEHASQLLQRLPQLFSTDSQAALGKIALDNSTLRSQSWYHLARLDHATAQTQLKQAASNGERAAIAAWLQTQGDNALPELKRWLSSKNETTELSAIYGLRLLATPAAQHLLDLAKHNATVSRRVRQELSL